MFLESWGQYYQCSMDSFFTSKFTLILVEYGITHNTYGILEFGHSVHSSSVYEIVQQLLSQTEDWCICTMHASKD